LLLTESETNVRRTFGAAPPSPFMKDAFHEYVVAGRSAAVKPSRTGTKAAGYCRLEVGAGQQVTLRLRLCEAATASPDPFGPDFEATFEQRRREADEYFADLLTTDLAPEE